MAHCAVIRRFVCISRRGKLPLQRPDIPHHKHQNPSEGVEDAIDREFNDLFDQWRKLTNEILSEPTERYEMWRISITRESDSIPCSGQFGNRSIAKAICDIPTTRDLVERLKVDRQMRNLCGWVLIHEIPSESTFSRAFAEFAESDLPGRMHKALVKEFIRDSIVGHVSRDSTAIPAHEKPTPKCKSDQKPMKRKRGRPRKGEERPPKDKTRLERQAAGDMTLEQMLDDLPKDCDRGAKVNAQGFRNAWIGYKLHIDAIDNGIPVVCILTSASVHDPGRNPVG